MSTCDDYQITIQFYVDDELTEKERGRLLLHFEHCIPCQKKLEEAQALTAQLRSARPLIKAPSSLYKAVLQSISGKEPS